MGQHTSFFVMRFVVFNYYFNRFAIMGLKLQKFVTSIGFKNWFIIRVLLQKSTVDPFYGRLQDHRLLWIMSRTCASSLTLICPGAEALVAAPKVRAEPKVSPGETADNTCTCHGHGNDRAVGELLGHFQRGT